jgi:catechol 2,3-dioxygenase-like lactoylglutathione lyase family enzyme
MTADWQVVVDAASPHDLADFWAAALGYEVEQHSDFIQGLLDAGAVQESETTRHKGVLSFADFAAVCHPDDAERRQQGTGAARRLLFQKVPEGKTVKNRVHVDINVGPDALAAEVERLEGLGATVRAEITAQGSHFFGMSDPEGNEFDMQ